MHQQNRNHLHRILARMTDYVETESGQPSQYAEYVRRQGKNRFEVEHILANKFERHREDYADENEFDRHRNRLGGLLLMPKSFNASYGAQPYEDKRKHYFGQKLLAQSLHESAYESNPGFLRFIEDSGLAFRPHESFTRTDLDARQELYTELAKRIWNPEDLLRGVEE
jgi:hypothetical protein